MKPLTFLVAATLLPGSLWALEPCVSHVTSVIDAEARCVDNGGISIRSGGDDGIKVACMQDKEVKGRCGPDGRLTRLRAYSEWFTKLKRFENECASGGGTFAYQDANFAEPQDESYCLQAVPEVGSNMFEEPLCNYRSLCPAVEVVCDRSCPEHSVVRLY
jgi:hypothetical protein